MGSEQPWGTILSSREMPSVDAFQIKLSDNKQTTILTELKTCSTSFLIFLKRAPKQVCDTCLIDLLMNRWVCMKGSLFGDPLSFLFHVNQYWALNCQKVDHAWLACSGGSSTKIFQVCSSLGFIPVPCPSPLPWITFFLSPLFTSCCSLQSNIDRGQ